MRKFVSGFFQIFFLAILLTCFAASGVAQDILILKEDKSKPPDSNMMELPESGETETPHPMLMIYERWGDFETAYQQGNTGKAEEILDDILNYKSSFGIERLTSLAVSLVHYANLELGRKNAEEALRFFRVATAFDPTLPITYYGQAKAQLGMSIIHLPRALSLGISGVLSPLSSLSGKIYFYTKFLMVLLVTLLLVGAAFALGVLLKHQRSLRHDIQERFGNESRKRIIEVIFWICLFAPVFFLAGPLWLAPFWLMIFFRYGKRTEKILSVLFVLIFMFAYPVLRKIVQVSTLSVDPAVSAYVTFFTDGASMKAVADFEKYFQERGSSDPDAAIVLAYLYKQDQRMLEAVALLQKHILEYPSDARAYNNLGNIHFSQGEIETALRLSQKAWDLDQQNPIYPFNLSILKRAKFNFDEAEQLLSRARMLNPSLIKELEASPIERLIEALPDPQLVQDRIEIRSGSTSHLLANPFTYFSAAMLFLILVFNIPGKKRNKPARLCTKCGAPFCKRCQSSADEYLFCVQCLHIFLKKDGVSPASRKQKVYEIEKFSHRQELLSRVSSLVLPGFGNFYRGKILSGVLILLFWFFFLTVVLFHWKFSRFSYWEPSGYTGILTTLFLGGMGIVYLFANVSMIKKSKA